MSWRVLFMLSLVSCATSPRVPEHFDKRVLVVVRTERAGLPIGDLVSSVLRLLPVPGL